MNNRTNRLDKQGEFRTAYNKNKKKILATQNICSICGKPVDKSLKFPHPLSATVDHIIPINKGGHPSDINNLQLAHLCCNRQKSDNLQGRVAEGGNKVQQEQMISNRVLPQSINWNSYKAE